jgi:hypothetical protein
MMINFQSRFFGTNDYSYKNNNDNVQDTEKHDIKHKHTYWKLDGNGNIVYYTVDTETGEIISKEVYKNPAAGLFGTT